ncbi:poly(U)-specific 3'-to-5' RNA exonuclease [Coemansia guatemalensis]|uniref:U6 snRNA phosphodiesterase 1 n=1 Tax=Coemansia guatemalensis TaxID=2761395 RepID=A0A9W8HX12_9FUNG|nr:poly(U)-specific 3'-to-5' RNA exonuclease [Coemansia guatemalensis]
MEAAETVEARDMGHVRGGWSGHVRLRIDGRSREQLHAVGLACIKAISTGTDDGSGDGQTMAEGQHVRDAVLVDTPHISVTRAFYVQEHQIQAFVRAVEACVADVGAFGVGFGGMQAFANERGDRVFVGVEVEHGADAVREVVERVDRVMERFGRRAFFRRARLHTSVVRMEVERRAGDGLAQGRQIARAVGALVERQMDEGILQRLEAARIDVLECIFGNRCFRIALGQQQP